MNDKIIAILVIMIFINGCNSQVNTTDPQISKNIQESKKNGVFLKQYFIESTTDKNIILEEAWTEKTWFYEIHNGKAIKVQKYGCRLCFNLKQTPDLKYNLKNLNNWLMDCPKIDFYVGIAYGVYELSYQDCNIPDTVSLDLIEQTETKTGITKTKVGTLTFRAINTEK